jgi:hypothetical protein
MKLMLTKIQSLSLLALISSAVIVCASPTPELNVTYSGAGVLTSSIADTIVFDFDNPYLLDWSTSEQNKWLNIQAGNTGIGTFSGVYFHSADVYGAAGGTGNYITEATLTLNTPASYFGLWWSAGDGSNQLNFYLSGNLVASFGSTILNSLSEDYNGNPNAGQFYKQNWGEKYAFINFYGANGFTFDQVQSIGGGFENDNWTIRNPAYGSNLYTGTESPNVLPGTYVGTLSSDPNSITTNPNIQSAPQLAQTASAPEASSICYAALAGLALAGAAYRRRKSKID